MPEAAGMHSLLMGSGRGLEDDPITNSVGSVLLGILLQRELANIISNALVDLDTAAWLADQTSQGAGLTGNGSLSNPQWTLAGFHHLYSALCISQAQMKLFKSMFIEQYAEAALEHPDIKIRRVQAAVFVDIFNGFVTETALRGGMSAPKAEWLMDVTVDMTAEALSAEIGRWPGIIVQLPFTSYLPGTRQSGRESAWDSVGDSFVSSIMDETQQAMLGKENDLIMDDIERVDLTPNTTRIANHFRSGKKVWGRVAGQTFLSTALDQGVDAVVDYATRSESKVERIAAGSLVVGRSVVSGVEMAASGAAAWATRLIPWAREYSALQFATASKEHFDTSIKAGFQLTQLYYGRESHTLKDQIIFQDSYTTLEWSSTYVSDLGFRDIPAPLQNVASAECDVIASAGLERRSMTLAEAEEKVLSDLLFSDKAVARNTLSAYASRSQGSTVPDTFRNRQAAAASLLVDYAQRHLGFSDYQRTGDTVSFFRSNATALVRREPEDRSASFPAITSAQMMCTSPGFVPMRAAEKDLSTLAALPSLRPISELAEGIDVEIR